MIIPETQESGTYYFIVFFRADVNVKSQKISF